MTSYEALTKRFGFKDPRLVASMYRCQKKDRTLLLVLQVDDYLYARPEWLAEKFEQLLPCQLHIGSTERNEVSIMGSPLSQDPTGIITINANKSSIKYDHLVSEVRKIKRTAEPLIRS